MSRLSLMTYVIEWGFLILGIIIYSLAINSIWHDSFKKKKHELSSQAGLWMCISSV